jgi:hypothetical protein
MSTTENSGTDEMTLSEHRDGEALIADIQKLIAGHDPALAAYAVASVLATLIANHALHPLTQARRFGKQLVDAVQNPPVNRLTH